MNFETLPFDPVEFLGDAETQAEFMTSALDSNDPAYIADAMGVVARARGMTQIAREAGVTREALYRSLSSDGDPRLSTLVGVLKALGISLTAKPIEPPVKKKEPV